MNARALLDRIAALPRARLAALPTPLVAAPALADAIGVEALWVKREDLGGFGEGGQKVRGLELLLGEAIAQGADLVVTGAGPQSNHVRATAAAAASLGLECVAVLWGDPPSRLQGNLALAALAGARLHFTGSGDRTSVDRHIEQVASACRRNGRRPYVIPRGGACGLGVLAHVLAAAELQEQCAASGLEPAVVFLAAGSGGTMAGWELARHVFGAAWQVEAVTVSRPAAEVRHHAAALAAAALSIVGWGECPVRPEELRIHDGFIGRGYGVPSTRGMAAVRLAWRGAGLLLDPTYTGKAFAALRALAREGRVGRDGPVVFVHTGGAQALHAHWSTVAEGKHAWKRSPSGE